MSTTTGNKTDIMIEEMKKIYNERESIGFKRGELKTLFEELAKKYGFSFYTVKTMYYKDIKNKVHTFLLTDETLTKAVEKTTYTKDSIIKVKVTNIIDYGAFVETVDENKEEGLIHISEVKNNYVEDIRDYFSIGDIVEAKIKRIDSKGRIELSTRELPLMHKNFKYDTITPAIQPIVSPREHDNFADILLFLNGMVGALSPKAKNQLKKMMDDYGLVKFTIAMIKTRSRFENDLGLKLLQEIESNIENCL